MVMIMRLDFQGIDQMIREYDQIERNLANQVRDKALIAGADVLEERMAAEVYSHGLTRRTGQAQDSITRTDPKDGVIFVGSQGGRKQQGFYLYMHEFGYYNVRAGRFIAPKPFASIAYQNSINIILDAMVQVVRRELRL